ncbi:hypothetical protein J4H92_12455 [Leucobacter weissii]|uniref:DUF3618 domain-containing protein n=1 Tax=Leucobacter weissii TaxID=1983706 RepID=A0A939S942_9MICO|nr:hypothetical protein [Leucobacter weissii]MBO1902756.1 hypothetical protein [Leucobacter weissii]
MSTRPNDPGVREAERARAELYDTLGKLRDRLDYAQRIDDALERTGRRIAEERRRNPLGFAAASVAAAAATGLAVWGIARAVMRRG